MANLLVDPITLDLKLQRLEFETGFNVRDITTERDRYKTTLVNVARELDGEGYHTWAARVREVVDNG